MDFRSLVSVTAAAAAISLFAAAPAVDGVTMTDNADGTVTVTYNLANPPAVVTMDMLDEDGNPVADEDLVVMAGDVNRKVAGTTGEIRWTPPAGFVRGSYTAKVTAWPVDDPPDYAVFDIATESSSDRVRYYTSADRLPGGLLGDVSYRSSKLVMRKVRARGVTWQMGLTAADGYYTDTMKQHEVTLSKNYYMAVFPLTCLQVRYITGSYATSEFTLERDLRIQDRIWYSLYTVGRGAGYPAAPTEGSILGKLRARLDGEFDFDFPTEAEWEFAARAGNASGYWGNGSKVTMTSTYYSKDSNIPGHYRGNLAVDWLATTTSWADDADFQGPTNAVPIAGSRAPNDWGLYDMNGGVWEWCLDWYQDDITALGGAVNVSLEDPTKCADGVSGNGTTRVVRGGGWDSWAYHCLPGYRGRQDQTYTGDHQSTGIRVVFHTGLRGNE